MVPARGKTKQSSSRKIISESLTSKRDERWWAGVGYWPGSSVLHSFFLFHDYLWHFVGVYQCKPRHTLAKANVVSCSALSPEDGDEEHNF